MLEFTIQTMQEGSWLPYNHHSNPERTNIQLFLSTMIFFSNKHLMSYFSEIDFMIKSYSKKLRGFNKLPLVNQWGTISSVTCVMQIMLVISAYTYTNELRNTKDWQSETISESNMIWNLTTLCRVFEF